MSSERIVAKRTHPLYLSAAIPDYYQTSLKHFLVPATMYEKDPVVSTSKTALQIVVFFVFPLFTCFVTGCQSNRQADRKLFEILSSTKTGLTFINEVEDTPSFNMVNYLNFYNGAGIAVGDVNNDSLVDLYFTANTGPNRLYLNKGHLQFEDVTEKSGVAATGNWKTGATMVDLNSDGFLDIYLSVVGGYLDREGRNQLFINNGDGTFKEQARTYGLDFTGYGQQAAFFDYDLDCDLDLYLLRHSSHSEGTYGNTILRNVRNERAGDLLLRNDEDHFTDVSQQAGIYSSATGYGLSVVIRDLDFDGCPDIFVANDFHEDDFLYYSNCDGTFIESVKKSMPHLSYSSMGSDAADLNNDGLMDIVVVDMLPDREDIRKTAEGADDQELYFFKRSLGYHHQYPRNMMHLNQGKRRFSEIAYLAGVYATDWSWGPLIADLDNDGLRDLFIANGIWRRSNDLDYSHYISQPEIQISIKELNKDNLSDALQMMPHVPIPNYVFRNIGGFEFENVATKWGLDQPGFSNGAVYTDLDNDGDLDLVLNNFNAPASLYENRSETLSENHFLVVQLEGTGANTQGIGAKVLLKFGNSLLFEENMPVRGWMSSIDPRLHFGLGSANRLDSLVVIWPDKKYQVLTNLPVDRIITLYQAQATGTYPYTSLVKPGLLFEDITDRLNLDFRHKENTFIDYNREPFMPHMLSREGPALAVGDVNGDSLDDFFVGGAKTQHSRLYVQSRDGQFNSTNENLWKSDSIYEDIDAAFFDADLDNDLDIYVVSGGNEWWGKQKPLRDRLYFNDGTGNFQRAIDALPDIYANGSKVAPVDFDGDGDTDLFVGSRSVAWKYGIIPQSYLLENDGKGHFSDVTTSRAEGLSDTGMVVDAVWTDYNNDEAIDLVIVGEWMPISLFEQQNGRFVLRNVPGLENTNGWWNAIAAADFDEDGDDDLIAGNLGLNSILKAHPDEPVQLFIGDFDKDDSLDQVITYYNHGVRYPAAPAVELLSHIETLGRKYKTYRDFGARRFEDLFPEKILDDAIVKTAYNFASSFIVNKGDGSFANSPLPVLAQFSTVNVILIDDFDRNGSSDILVAGNEYDVQPIFERRDASYGVFLKGNGHGSFEAQESSKTGLYFEGEIQNLRFLRRVDGSRVIIAARNDAPLQVIKIKEEKNR